MIRIKSDRFPPLVTREVCVAHGEIRFSQSKMAVGGRRVQFYQLFVHGYRVIPSFLSSQRFTKR